MHVVGVTGYAQHGKDTFAARLVERHGYTRFAFADALKSMALALDPTVFVPDSARLSLGAYVDDEVSAGLYASLANIVADTGWEGAKQVPEVRRFLQVLGTEGVRDHIGEDSWVRACERAIRGSGVDRVVITDTRFPNEAAWVHSVGGSMVRVVRPGFDNGIGTEHPSEQYIADLPVDAVVKNGGDITDLCMAADALALDIEEGFGRLRVTVQDVTDAPITTEYEALQRRYAGEGR